jgi:hypothetical protein
VDVEAEQRLNIRRCERVAFKCSFDSGLLDICPGELSDVLTRLWDHHSSQETSCQKRKVGLRDNIGLLDSHHGRSTIVLS